MLRTELHLWPCTWNSPHNLKSLPGAQRSLAADPAGPFNAHSHDREGERFSPISFCLPGAVSSRGRTGDVVAPRR
jgi:hypothetical protein